MDPGLRPVPGAALTPRVGGSVGPLCLSQPRCRGTGQRVPLVPPLCRVVVLSPVGALANYGFFFNFLGLFFCFFGSKLTPPGALEKARLCPGGCRPASPAAQGSEQRCCSGDGTVGRSQIFASFPSQIPTLELEIWGIRPCVAPPATPRGIGAGPWLEQQRMDTAQCLCECVAAWDGAAGDGWGKNRESSKMRIKWSFPQGPTEEMGRVSACNRGAGAAAWRGYDSGARRRGR